MAVGEAGDAGSWTGRASAVLPQREMTEGSCSELKPKPLHLVNIIYYIVSSRVASTTLCNCSVMPSYRQGLLSCLYWFFRLFYLVVYVRAKDRDDTPICLIGCIIKITRLLHKRPISRLRNVNVYRKEAGKGLSLLIHTFIK